MKKNQFWLYMIYFFALSLTMPAQQQVGVIESNELKKDLLSKLEKKNSEDEKVFYLASILSSTNAANQEIKAESIRQLSALETDEAVETLVRNITYIHESDGLKTPLAQFELIKLGEKSVPHLIKVIESSDDPHVLNYAVPALIEIKGTNYHKFYMENKNTLSTDLLKKLNRFAVM